MANSDPERQAREQIAKTEEAEARDRATGMASLFDLRMVIGGLLALYGVTLTVMGVFASDQATAKAARATPGHTDLPNTRKATTAMPVGGQNGVMFFPTSASRRPSLAAV